MRAFDGFELTECLHEGRSTVWRGRRSRDELPVVLKVLENSTSAEQTGYFKYAYDVMRDLALPGVVTVVDLLRQDGCHLLVMKDVGGRSLESIRRERSLSPVEVVRFAIVIAETLGQLHQRGIIHQDISPANIVVHSDPPRALLIDFELASRLSSEEADLAHPATFRGTLEFVSPERTGRTSCSVDHRTDLYSFGATLFTLLTGRPPFDNSDPLALFHRHVAMAPPAPREVAPGVPEALSQIVLKLLAKAPEDRYQSAYGLEMDLKTCLDQMEALGEATAPFPLARRDVSARFQISQKLYGREAEVGCLVAAFEDITRVGSGVVLVSGNPGVGKSRLINAIHGPIALRQGTFLAGKFDQYGNIPYAALLQALDQFVQDLLARPPKEIEHWARDIGDGIGGLGQVLVEQLPVLERIIGPQPDLPDLPPGQALNRLQRAFQLFFRVICVRLKPVVLFIDDLQWASPASLRLLQGLFESADISGLLLIGAYRREGVTEGHALADMRFALGKTGASLSEVSVGPLDSGAVCQLVADSVCADTDAAEPLSEVIYARTQGNPFYTTQFLESIHADGGLTYDPAAGRWRWDLAQVERMGVTDNVAELITRKLGDLPQATQNSLHLAACLGSQFDLRTLALVEGQPPAEVAETLWPALQSEVLRPVGDTWRLATHLAQDEEASSQSVVYRFVHDRVQEAAYKLNKHPAPSHLRIGRVLHPRDSEATAISATRLFQCASQYNQGFALLDTKEERLQVCGLNYEAGTRARRAAAFKEFFDFVESGLRLLPSEGWSSDHDLTLKLHLAGIEAAYLVADHEAMRRWSEATSAVGQPRVKAEVARIHAHAAMGREEFGSAIDKAIEGLGYLGVRIPQTPTKFAVVSEFLRTSFVLRCRPPENLLARPEASDPDTLTALDLLGVAWSSSYNSRPELLPICAFKIVQLGVRDGMTPLTPWALAQFATSLLVIGDQPLGWLLTGNVPRAVKRFGDLALRLADEPLCQPYRAWTRLWVYDFLHHWQHPLGTIIDPMYDVYQEALEAGHLETAAVATVVGINAMSGSGVPLPEIAERSRPYADAIRRQEAWFFMHELARQRVLNLMGQAAGDPWHLAGETGFDESIVVPKLRKDRAHTTLCGYHMIKCWLAFLLHRYDEAREHADQVIPVLSSLVGSIQYVAFSYYDALICLRTIEVPGRQRRHVPRRVTSNLNKLRRAARWAAETWSDERTPVHFQHWADLVAAEQSRVRGRAGEAADYFDRAIEGARAAGCLEDQAIANELAGRFHVARKRQQIGRAYLREAYSRFAEWGAEAILRVLKDEFPWIADADTVQRGGSTWFPANHLDPLSVMKASREISGEIELDKLVRRLMSIVVEAAGADRATLCLRERDELQVVAQTTGLDQEPVVGPHRAISDATDVAQSVVRYVERTGHEVILGDVSHSRFSDDPHVRAGTAKSVFCLPIDNQNRRLGILYLENSVATDAFSRERVDLLKTLSGQIAISLDNARIYEAQGRFVPEQFLNALDHKDFVSVGLGDHVEKELSILFADVRGFTGLVERMDPKRHIDFINRYFGWMEPAVLGHDGFIDSYIGDAIMALFDRDQNADDAVSAALDMLEALRRLNVERVARGEPILRTGIGISTGKVMLGTIGGQKHFKCSVIGDNVNLASRVESLTKRYGVSLLISESTREKLRGSARDRIRRLDRVRVVGRDTPVTIYEVMDGDVGPTADDKLRHLEMFNQATTHYFNGAFAEGLALFERYGTLVPQDHVAALFVSRCQHHLDQGRDEPWDGVEPMPTK